MLSLISLALMLGSRTLVPYAEASLHGSFSGGTLASWAADDGDGRTISRNIPQQPFLFPYARVRLSYRLGSPHLVPRTLEIRVKVTKHNLSPHDISLFVFDKTSNNPVPTSVFEARVVDGTTYVGTVNGPLGRFVGQGGRMDALIEVWKRGRFAESQDTDPISPFVTIEFAHLVVGS